MLNFYYVRKDPLQTTTSAAGDSKSKPWVLCLSGRVEMIIRVKQCGLFRIPCQTNDILKGLLSVLWMYGTRLQVPLAMAHNLSICTRCKKRLWRWKKCQKRAKNCLKVHTKGYNLHISRRLVSPVCLSPSRLQADWCLQGTLSNFDEHSSCRQLQINLRAIFSGRISWNSLWPLRIMIYFIRATFQKFLDGRSGPFHHH